MSSYQELLRHPKWQRKRLEIMQRADFKCERCGAEDSMLAIHHSYYEKGCSPWEYPDSSLHCLCEKCHDFAHSLTTALNKKMAVLSMIQRETLLGYVIGIERAVNRPLPRVRSRYVAKGLADARHCSSALFLAQSEPFRLEATPSR